MAFTDDDLKKWKEWCESFSPQARKLPMIAKEEALFSRLEAAEEAHEYVMRKRDEAFEYKTNLSLDRIDDLDAFWRKAAGK